MLDLAVLDLLIIFLSIFCSYIIFGIAGFGTALVASPVLIHYMPLATIIPLLALMDLLAAIKGVSRDFRQAEVKELKRLVPLMVGGSCIGALILINGKPDILMIALGVFVTAYSVYALLSPKSEHRFSPISSIPFGLTGGVFSALFGSGGFIYAIYLTGRLDVVEKIRVTQTTLIGFSTFTRVVIFLFAGIYVDTELLLITLLLFPAMYIGTNIGRSITLNMPKEKFKRIVSILILIAGIVLIAKYFDLH